MTEFGQGSVHTLSGAYVLDALDDAERAAFEEHLPGCADCTAEVAGLREAAALLADDAALTPPASMRAGVLAGIRTIRPLPPETGAEVVTLRPRRTRLLGLMVAAAVVAILAVAAIAQPWHSGNGHATNPADRVVAASDAVRTEVRLPGGATATVVRSPSLGKAALVTRDMPAPPSGKVYEVWLQHDPGGPMAPAGLMTGRGSQRLLLEGDTANAIAAAISVEPPGGSPKPTSTPIATFDLQSS